MLLVRVQTGCLFWKAVRQCVNSFVYLPFDPVSPLLGNYPKGIMKNVDTHLQRFIAVLARASKQLMGDYSTEFGAFLLFGILQL